MTQLPRTSAPERWRAGTESPHAGWNTEALSLKQALEGLSLARDAQRKLVTFQGQGKYRNLHRDLNPYYQRGTRNPLISSEKLT